METLKINITKASKGIFWYRLLIGQEVVAISYEGKYMVKVEDLTPEQAAMIDPTFCAGWVEMNDATLVTPPAAAPTVPTMTLYGIPTIELRETKKGSKTLYEAVKDGVVIATRKSNRDYQFALVHEGSSIISNGVGRADLLPGALKHTRPTYIAVLTK
jgi:hypothetical protein